MELKLAVICDSANVSQEGKLNILGEFDTIWGKQVPVTWPSLTLVARFEAHIVEGSKHRLAIDLTDADGTSILDKRLESELPFSPSGPGRPHPDPALRPSDRLPAPRPSLEGCPHCLPPAPGPGANLSVDEKTVWGWESGEHRPWRKNRERVEGLFAEGAKTSPSQALVGQMRG